MSSRMSISSIKSGRSAGSKPASLSFAWRLRLTDGTAHDRNAAGIGRWPHVSGPLVFGSVVHLNVDPGLLTGSTDAGKVRRFDVGSGGHGPADAG